MFKLSPFLQGYFSFWIAQSLYQDWKGKEETIKLIDNHWIDAKYTVPLALLVAIWVAYSWLSDQTESRDNESNNH